MTVFTKTFTKLERCKWLFFASPANLLELFEIKIAHDESVLVRTMFIKIFNTQA